MTVVLHEDRPVTRPVTMEEAADLVDVSPSTVRRWAAQGLLPTILYRGRRYAREIDVYDVDREQRRKAMRRPGGDRRATPTLGVILDRQPCTIAHSSCP